MLRLLLNMYAHPSFPNFFSFTMTLIRELHLLLLLYCGILISLLHQWQLLFAQRQLRRDRSNTSTLESQCGIIMQLFQSRESSLSRQFSLSLRSTRRDGEERIVDPLRDLLTNSEDEEDESDSDPDSQSRSMMLIPVIALRSRSSWNISLSLGQTGRNDIRKVLTSVMNWELKRKWYQSELNMNLRTLQIVMH